MYELRKERERRGMTLRELSDKTGISVPDLSLLERQLCPAHPEWKRRIATALRKPMRRLFKEVPDDE